MRILTDDAIMLVDGDCFMVEGYSKYTKPQEGYAYLMSNGLVYPYRGKYDSMLSFKPGLYTKKKEHVVIPFPKEQWELYSEDNLITLDPRRIIKELSNNPDDFADRETIEEALSNGEMLRPVIKDTDDFLKYLIKSIILEKGVSVNQCKKAFKTTHEFPNLKQALEKDTKMTVTNFKRCSR